MENAIDKESTVNLADATLQFINSTSGHIFLTGKAGTGKTTFLKRLSERTHKQFAVVAPTGIAALNAGGVTIHSQFLLPLGSFLPDRSLPSDFNSKENFYTQSTLARKHPLNSVRKQVLRSIDLLVIDEVSMLRADLLDAIDYRLKAARGNFRQSFGGVQLLLIGDLYQLPPIVKRDEESMLQRYYNSPWFYESLALKQDGFVYIELDKIFRQQDDTFIHILNNLRNNTPTAQDIDELNRHYKTEEEIKSLEEVITLTTHNYKADEMNKRALNELVAPSFFMAARIEGEFPESMYPVLANLELKVGAQVMFIRNDSEGQMYFNGKLATVSEVAEDRVVVVMAETHEEFELKKERWENKKYSINTETRDLDDEVIGTFDQYPIKLAWAITVHKSQGLTFDKAIIDVGQAFADGQVYVALSRLRTLDGLILRTKINPNVISTDSQIVNFTRTNNKPETLPELVQTGQQKFIRQLIEKTFDLESLTKEIRLATQTRKEAPSLDEKTMSPVLEQIAQALEDEKENTQKFRRQLLGLLEDQSQLLERVKKGSEYYRALLIRNEEELLTHRQEISQQKRVKTYLNNLDELDQLISKKLSEVDKSQSLIEGILLGELDFDFTHLAQNRAKERANLLVEIEKRIPSKAGPGKKRKGKRKKDSPSTYDITLQMLETGMDVAAIAKERELVVGTILGHLAKAVEQGRISIFKFMSERDVEIISDAVKEMPDNFTSKDLFSKLNAKYGYGHLRAVMNHLHIKPSTGDKN